MVLMPSLHKIGCGLASADEQLRFSLGAIQQPLCYLPPTLDKELRLPFRQAHKIADDEGEDDDSIRCSEPDFRKREVCLTLIQTHNLCQESCAATAAISWLDKWQRHFLLHIYSPPFMLAWELNKPTECGAVQKGSTGNVVQ